MPTLDDVSRIAASLPGTIEKPSGGGLAWFVRRNPYAWEQMPWPSQAAHIRALVSSETCLGVRLPSEDEKRALLQGWPDVFTADVTPWLGTKVIVRLAAVELDHLGELVIESWRTQAPKYLRSEFDGS
ncbi:hypothetical protein BH11ACT3_BH11ACT3_19320 [soil metagenome]